MATAILQHHCLVLKSPEVQRDSSACPHSHTGSLPEFGEMSLLPTPVGEILLSNPAQVVISGEAEAECGCLPSLHLPLGSTELRTTLGMTVAWQFQGKGPFGPAPHTSQAWRSGQSHVLGTQICSSPKQAGPRTCRLSDGMPGSDLDLTL